MLTLWNKERRKNKSFQDTSGMRDKTRRLQSFGSLPQNLFICILHHVVWFWTHIIRALKGEQTRKMSHSLRNSGISGHGGTFKTKAWPTRSLKMLAKFTDELKFWLGLCHHRMINSEIKDVNGTRKQKRERESRTQINPRDHPWWSLCATKLITGFKHFWLYSSLLYTLSSSLCLSVLQCWMCE